MKIRLETRDGGLVAEKEILPFQILPEVVLWGERYFAFVDYTGCQMPRYREVSCYPIIEVSDGT